MREPLPLRSLKVHRREGYARAVPREDGAGCPFAGPGVTVQGEAYGRVAVAAERLYASLASFEPGIVVRSLSLDFDARRLLAVLEPTVPDADPRGRVVRIDGGAFEVVAAAATELVEELGREARLALERRRKNAAGC